jgi:hypothetical protein
MTTRTIFFLCSRVRSTSNLRDRTITLNPGEIFVVPTGVEHRPVARGVSRLRHLFKPSANSHTGEASPQILLLLGIAGTWLFMTIGLGAAAWLIWTTQGFAIGTSGIGVGAKADDEGPIQWVHNFPIEGGGSQNVFSLRFRGANISKSPIELKEASIVSLIDGTLLPLEILGIDSRTEKNRIVSLDKVQLIAPGAPIELVAKFGAPDPAMPENLFGLEPRQFLEKWRQFAFNAKDDSRLYRMDFNENSMMPFFQGQVGPRVMIKPELSEQPPK